MELGKEPFILSQVSLEEVEEVLQIIILNVDEVDVSPLVQILFQPFTFQVRARPEPPILDINVMPQPEVRVDRLPPDLEAGLVLVRDAQVLEGRIDHPLPPGSNQVAIQADVELLEGGAGSLPAP